MNHTNRNLQRRVKLFNIAYNYTKFKPCLDEIKTFDKSNLISVAERKGFVVSDLRQLVTPYDRQLELRNNLLTEIQPDHICLPKISKF